ncbi:MAG: hypothetical protein ACJ74O_18090 [Frankiaceae bacterium]
MVGVLCASVHLALEVLGDRGCPGLSVDGAYDCLLVDEQALEEELVGQASGAGATEAVDLVAAAEQLQGAGEVALDVA